MEAAITLPAGPTPGLFSELGGAIFSRAIRLLRDDAAAARVAEALFVRFVVHGSAAGLDARARWTWIYRVVTVQSLRQLDDDATPGGGGQLPSLAGRAGASSLPAGPRVPAMRALRRLDEATQSMVVLSALDGLSAQEIAEVLDVPVKLVGSRIAAAAAAPAVASSSDLPDAGRDHATHPSTLALDADRGSHGDHLAACVRCRELVEEGDRLTARFASEFAPVALQRVVAAVRAERARKSSGPNWTRILWLGGGLIAVAALALLVTRPRAPSSTEVPYAGLKGASRAKSAGIQISVGRGAEVRSLDPAMALRSGDRLFFRVKAERPRYLELRVRDANGERRVFPVGERAGESAFVRPGQAVDSEYTVTSAVATAKGPPAPPVKTETLWIIGRFADHPFPLDHPPGPDIEVVPARVEVQP